MNILLITLIVIAMGITLFSLIAGLIVMTKGGKINETYGNKLMRMRVYFQGIAIALLALAFYMSHSAS